MKRPWFVPSPISAVCGGLLFVLLCAFGALLSHALPPLLDLLERSPRLAMLGLLGLALSPVLAVSIVHHVVQRAMDKVEGGARGVLPGTESWWAGAHAWLVMYGTSVIASLAMLVVEPPELDPDMSVLASTASTAVHRLASPGATNALYIAVWVFIASSLFELERRARPTKNET